MMHNNAAEKIDFFQKREMVFINEIVPKLEYKQLQMYRNIYVSGEYADAIYFLAMGRVSYILNRELIVFKSILSGNYFGDFELISNIPRIFSAIAETDIGVLIMSPETFNLMNEKFPKITN